jgi:hypothetical protein
MSEQLLTDEERNLVATLGYTTYTFSKICGKGDTRDPDQDEWARHVNALQNMVLAQAAARAYPEEFRLLGETFELRNREQ